MNLIKGLWNALILVSGVAWIAAILINVFQQEYLKALCYTSLLSTYLLAHCLIKLVEIVELWRMKR